jgi:hypothetical protein
MKISKDASKEKIDDKKNNSLLNTKKNVKKVVGSKTKLQDFDDEEI